MAISINGKITIGKDDSDWVTDTDWGEFEKLMKDCGNMLMGRRTYEAWGDEFPAEGVLNVVMTSDKDLLTKKTPKNVIFTDSNPGEVIRLMKEKGQKKIMLIGGQDLNTSFFKENLIDEVWLSVHPLIIGKGLEILGEIGDYVKKLEHISTKDLDEGLVQIRYKLKN